MLFDKNKKNKVQVDLNMIEMMRSDLKCDYLENAYSVFSGTYLFTWLVIAYVVWLLAIAAILYPTLDFSSFSSDWQYFCSDTTFCLDTDHSECEVLAIAYHFAQGRIGVLSNFIQTYSFNVY